MENKCESQKFKHAWVNTTPNIVYPTYPPQSPSKQETCSNCQLIRYHRTKTTNWIEYSDGKPHQDSYMHENGSTTISNISLTGSSGNITDSLVINKE